MNDWMPILFLIALLLVSLALYWFVTWKLLLKYELKYLKERIVALEKETYARRN